jgi:hypothetical protein
MRLVMARLSLDVPSFRLTRRVVVSCESSVRGRSLHVEGVDSDDTPHSLFKRVSVAFPVGPAKGAKASSVTVAEEPFRAAVPVGATAATVRCELMGHYNEPPMVLAVPLPGTSATRHRFVMSFDPMERGGEWREEASE